MRLGVLAVRLGVLAVRLGVLAVSSPMVPVTAIFPGLRSNHGYSYEARIWYSVLPDTDSCET